MSTLLAGESTTDHVIPTGVWKYDINMILKEKRRCKFGSERNKCAYLKIKIGVLLINNKRIIWIFISKIKNQKSKFLIPMAHLSGDNE